MAQAAKQQELFDRYPEGFPVRTPGAIQSHGFLLAVNPTTFVIEHVSQNVSSYLDQTAEKLLGESLHFIFSEQQILDLEAILNKQFHTPQTHHFAIEVQGKQCCFSALMHQIEELLILELEPTEAKSKQNIASFQEVLEDALMQMQQVTYLRNLLLFFVEKIRHLTGFERVLVYRFDRDGVGIIEAESKAEHMTSYLGLHFPNVDIPVSARELFQMNALRLISDVEDEPIPLLALNDSELLDLSYAILRPPSPCHVQYLQNMDVAASMVMPLIKDGQLWGLINCHHSSPKHIPCDIRTACVFLGKLMCLELNNKLNYTELQAQKQQQAYLSEFIEAIAQADDLQTALTEPDQTLLALIDAHGAAICLDGEITCIGKTPEIKDIRDFLSWANSKIENNIFYTEALAEEYLPAENFQAIASGIFLLQISKVRQYSILWFRPEVSQTIKWAGEPEAQLVKNDDGDLELSPRRSFEVWKETVHHRSLPWRDSDIKIALELRSSLVGIVLNKADELANLNLELQRSNKELDSFAYAASHDLQEPLRGIYNYANLMIRDYPDALEEEGVKRLATIMKLTQRMQSLIEALLYFSRLGQTEIKRQVTDLNVILSEEMNLLQLNHEQAITEFVIPRSLPIVKVDPIVIREAFSNLLNNALKYNTQSHKLVEIGYLAPDDDEFGVIAKEHHIKNQFIYYVKDNGIGIRDRHLHKIFTLFKRLHGREQFGGGTGVGLTITRKIIEHHGGTIWVTSDYGKGSTFYFTLNTSCSEKAAAEISDPDDFQKKNGG
ncbi:multi-sensor signal transduction histidine kinase [[Leptolyngbya] sp. PCC 7376]|uniref:ATP-binding protein n=1 Tax=[Leptolyngbya] sp. PCC 7376 TaxID=111781 RepID=UPI00029EFE52|nr:ATP-binding protein [[Leptolyngbya] sp. PCC 7376]AFY36767.1 multi-sensor signal transduction histidine kinase [[Leptolyngbya] sp. PCC 7376]